MFDLITSLSKKYFPIFLFIISLLILFRAVLLEYHPDFSAYYFGSKISLAGVNPFPDSANYHTPNAYPMFVYLLFAPFTLFDFVIAQKIWIFASIAFLVLSIHFIFKIFKKNMFDSQNILLTGFIFLTFFPTKFTLGMGQINLFILLLTVMFIYYYQGKKEKLAAVFLGLSIAIKFFPPLLFVYLFIKKEFKLIFYTIVVFLFANILGIAAFGFEYTSYFYTQILPELASGWKGDYYNQALTGLLTREIADTGVRSILKYAISGILVLATLIALFKSTKKDTYSNSLAISLIITLSLLINNFSWQHHFVWLLFPLLTVYLYLWNKKASIKFFIILAASYILVAVNFPNPAILPSLLQSHVFFGALILWGLNYYLLLNKKVK